MLRTLSRLAMAPRVALSAVEAQFVGHLDAFSRKLDPPVECRIAGGWVRDKLLALPSHDLDIALSIPSGYTFATEFVDYLKTQNVATHTVGKVAVNPEQSKHLETGTTRIMGLECDFVGLRSETYADSRIPTEVRLGTPKEDALRRDLTINALFYNVHSQEVEDHTGKGLDDLRDRIARTPLEPLKTFHDDPLRVIRCIRFASRYDLTIEPSVVDAIRDPEVKAALATKVSKERIGIEVGKMIGKTPYSALKYIIELGLHDSVFESKLEVDRSRVATVCEILKLVEERLWGDTMLWYAAATSPFRGLVIKGKREIPAVAQVLSESVKTSNEIRDAVVKIFQSTDLFDTEATSRSTIGTTLQHPSVKPWRRSIIWSIVTDIEAVWSGKWDEKADGVLQRYQRYIDRIAELKLDEAVAREPLLDGNAIKKLLELKPGPILGLIREAVNIWQLDHPEAAQEECAVWLKTRWSEGGEEEWRAAAAAMRSKKT